MEEERRVFPCFQCRHLRPDRTWPSASLLCSLLSLQYRCSLQSSWASVSSFFSFSRSRCWGFLVLGATEPPLRSLQTGTLLPIHQWRCSRCGWTRVSLSAPLCWPRREHLERCPRRQLKPGAGSGDARRCLLCWQALIRLTSLMASKPARGA